MANIHNEYRVERLSRDRLHDLELLHNAVYGRWPAENYFPQKYDTAYTGISHIGYIAYDTGNLPVAYYGVLPCFMQLDGKQFLAAQSGDTMTHPAHQKKGLFVELANRTYELCRQNGIQLVYGFPNQNSEHGLINKLGWTTTGHLDRFQIAVSCWPKERIARQFGWSRSLYKKYCMRVLRKFLLPEDGIKNAAGAEGFGCVLRSDRYLAYKRYSPAFVIQIKNARLWIRLNHDLTIGDMECIDEDFQEVIGTLKNITARLGLPAIHFQLSPGTRLHRLFADNFPAITSFPVCLKDLGSGLPLEKFKFSFADIDVF